VTKQVVTIGLVVVLALAAAVAFNVFRTPAEASEPIQAVPLDIEPTQAIEEIATVTVAAPEVTAAATPTAEVAAESSSPLLFEIDQDESQVTFELDEDLRGVRTTVVGLTNQVAGQIAFNPVDLATLQVGLIQVNARTLATDNDFRNRAIQNEILDTGSYEYITFGPTAIEGVPDSVAVGETVSFTIVGDLTIRDITRPATFDVTATLLSDSELSGTASTAVLLEDYNLNIPSVPQVANVEEEVALAIEFLANAS
jgi:polyisoprenoid-binding protein YceI